MRTTLIDVAALSDEITRVCLLDCRVAPDGASASAAFEHGHLPGAVRLDLETDLSGPGAAIEGRHPLPDRETLAATLRASGLSPGMQAVAYDDQGGAYAARAWWLLRWLGHEAVAVLDGDMRAWIEAGGVLETGPARSRVAGDFTASAEPAGWTADAAEIAARIGAGPLCVVDARTRARFDGVPHPLDALSGHIPGARSRFFGDNLGPDGRFKPAAQLREDYAATLASTAPADVVMQCGSGVTACHNLLAMAIADLPGARLYPASWSGWTADPARPITRG